MPLSTNGSAWRRAVLPASIGVLVAAAAAAVVVGTGPASVAAAADDPRTHSVTVSGTGLASGTPDVLRVEIGVQRTGQNVNAALNAANDDIRRIKAALARHGVADADIQTSQLSINPHYDPYYYGDAKEAPAPQPAPDEPRTAPSPGEGGGEEPAIEPMIDVAPDGPADSGDTTSSDVAAAEAERSAAGEAGSAAPMTDTPAVLGTPAGISARPGGGGINGYDVFHSLSVKLRDLAKAGAAISEAADAGGNATRINGVSFEIEDNSGLLTSARDAAFADAKAKAEQYARLAGRSLGRVAQVNENGHNSGPPIMYGGARAEAAMDSSVPFQPGSAQISVSNTVVWELN